MRRGSLSIGTNAIVVLIIAVIILGLIVGFIETTLGNITNRVQSLTEEEPEPRAPTTYEPMTVSREVIRERPKTDVGVKLKVINVLGSGDILPNPSITCSGKAGAPDTIGEQWSVQGTTIPAGEIREVLFAFSIADNAEEGTYLCEIDIGNTEIAPVQVQLKVSA